MATPPLGGLRVVMAVATSRVPSPPKSPTAIPGTDPPGGYGGLMLGFVAGSEIETLAGRPVATRAPKDVNDAVVVGVAER